MVMEKTTGKKLAKTPAPVVTDEYKILQELKNMNDNLKEIKEILDNMWRERRPQ